MILLGLRAFLDTYGELTLWGDVKGGMGPGLNAEGVRDEDGVSYVSTPGDTSCSVVSKAVGWRTVVSTHLPM